jgi:outer membrane immunogenic protein
MRTLFIFMATLIAIPLYSQKNHVFGIKTGLNLSRFASDGNSESNFKPGFNIGFYVKTPLSKNLFLRPEVFYSCQGQKLNYTLPGSSISAKQSIRANYLNVPLLLEAGKKLTLQIGPQVSYLLTANNVTTTENSTTKEDIRSTMKDLDLSAVIGVGINPHPAFNAGMRINYGLTDVTLQGSSAEKTRNHVFHVYVGYTF